MDEQLSLVVGVVRARVRHVVEDVVAGKAVPLGRCKESLRPKGAFSVDVKALAWICVNCKNQISVNNTLVKENNESQNHMI